MRPVRAIALVLATLVLVAIHVTAVVRVALPPPPPADVTPVAPAHAPLTRHLVLVIVDGLRYDVGTDAALMPHFAQAMRDHSSALILSGAVSMTSSAVLAYATGQPGDLDQVVENETAHATRFNHLPGNARAAGLTTAATGDWAWFTLVPASAWDALRPDPEGVALDVDYNPEILEAAYGFLARDPLPNLMVFHFVSPDHQAHAYGVRSAQYEAHIHAFDDKLRALLAAIPADTTIFVTSDHGATEGGKHGADSPIMRRSPIFAYGPGITPGLHPDEPLDQLDLSATFAHLLGIATPAHSEGHVLAEWLALAPAERADIACAELARLGRYASAELGIDSAASALCPEGEPATRIAAARAQAQALALRLEGDQPAESLGAWSMMLATLAAALVLVVAWSSGLVPARESGSAPRSLWARLGPSVAVALLVLSASVVLTRSVENLPGRWPNGARIGLLAAGNLVLVGTLLFRRAFFAALDRRAPWLGVLCVAVLAATQDRHTLAEAYLLLAGAMLVVVILAFARRRTPASAPLPLGRALLALACLVCLWPLGFRDGDFWSPWLTHTPWIGRAAVLAAMAVFALERLLRGAGSAPLSALRRTRGRERSWHEVMAALLLVALGGAALFVRSSVPGAVGFGLSLSLPAFGMWLWARGAWRVAPVAWLAGYAWIARDLEVLPLLGCWFLAECAGELGRRVTGDPSATGETAAAADMRDGADERTPRPALVAGLVAGLFALTFLQRVGVNSHIDFTGIDWASGTFGDSTTSMARIGASNVGKYMLARGVVVGLCLAPLAPRLRRRVALGLLAVELGRVVLMTALLFICKNSFWTSFRVLGDMPHALIGAVVATLACAAVGVHRLRLFARAPQGEPAGESGPRRERPQAAVANPD